MVNTASAIMGDTSQPAQVPSLESLGCQAQPGAGPTAQALVGSETPAPAQGSGDAASAAGPAAQADSGNGVYGSVNRVSGLL